MTRIINGTVFTPSFTFEQKEVLIRDGIFADCPDETADEALIDASGCYVIPGLIDIHFHGCMGADVCDGTEEALHTIASWEASQGITAICPATLTLPVGELCGVLRNMAGFAQKKSRPEEADLVGVNMEGPFISPVKKGAQNSEHILPCDEKTAGEFLAAGGGLVKIMGLAPEENPGYRTYIEKMKEKAVISLAHTNADYDTAMDAFAAGASHAVHLCNGMPEMLHRAPGVIGAVADSGQVTAELICDGNHVHPAFIRAVFDMLGARRIVLISDSLRAAGMGDGRMSLGGLEVEVKGTRATLAGSDTLAGSVANLRQCLVTAVKKAGIPLEDAVRCATINPAKVIGVQDRYGSIEPGKKGSVLLLEKETLNLRAVIKDGVML